MTVRELIEALQREDPDAVALVHDGDCFWCVVVEPAKAHQNGVTYERCDGADICEICKLGYPHPAPVAAVML